MTPHQYQDVAAFVDTLWVTTYCPDALDIAVPHAAAQWIAQSITTHVIEHFTGRLAAIELGATLYDLALTPELLARLEQLPQSKMRFGVLLTDRALTAEQVTLCSTSGVPWVVLDWWQWFRRRVPPQRVMDAWMFLAHTHRTYTGSREHRELGLDAQVSAEMTRQGTALLGQVVAWSASELRNLWQDSPKTFEDEEDKHS